MNYIKLFITTSIVFFLLDMLWLGFIAKDLYIKNYGPWLRLADGSLEPLWWAAFVVYLLLVLGILIFVIPNAQGSVIAALGYGALFGLITYGVYDFTCLAVFKDFPVPIAFIDTAWGIVLCAITSSLTVWFEKM